MITAKVKLAVKYTESGNSVLTFAADYADGRNKEWSKYTPYLNLAMGVKPEIAEKFEVGTAYTLQFVPDEG